MRKPSRTCSKGGGSSPAQLPSPPLRKRLVHPWGLHRGFLQDQLTPPHHRGAGRSSAAMEGVRTYTWTTVAKCAPARLAITAHVLTHTRKTELRCDHCGKVFTL
ncbi:hypothetical protein GWK47_046917 [Chionoecetes opilio]|uniref:Uncharacterized protein n=1 Tax=Chionoecetes opilio TaxID=41210 RepID=A0A8J4Y600_CHIOP|nr:hypothetical protein GWK47_046917 [Chionoecetes opilio]